MNRTHSSNFSNINKLFQNIFEMLYFTLKFKILIFFNGHFKFSNFLIFKINLLNSPKKNKNSRESYLWYQVTKWKTFRQQSGKFKRKCGSLWMLLPPGIRHQLKFLILFSWLATARAELTNQIAEELWNRPTRKRTTVNKLINHMVKFH